MKVYTFIYIISNIIILQLISLESEVVNNILNILCSLGIATLGIAHGSVDNILYGVKSRKSNGIFIFIYVLLTLAFAGLWAISPNFAFISFLLVSAYHFGQSQLEEYHINSVFFQKSLFTLWGSIVLLLPMVFNKAELISSNGWINNYISIMNVLIFNASDLLIGFGTVFIIMLLAYSSKHEINIQVVLKEIYTLALIIFSFKILPPFIAFSLFFIIIHSFKVIRQEYSFCQKNSTVSSVQQFIKLCLPLTLVSLIGVAIVVSALYLLGKTSLIPLSLIILLSSVTFPHSLVMEKFYLVYD